MVAGAAAAAAKYPLALHHFLTLALRPPSALLMKKGYFLGGTIVCGECLITLEALANKTALLPIWLILKKPKTVIGTNTIHFHAIRCYLRYSRYR